MKKDLTKKILWTVGLGLILSINLFFSIYYIVNMEIYNGDTVLWLEKDITALGHSLIYSRFTYCDWFLFFIFLMNTILIAFVIIKLWKPRKTKNIN
jgi:hypothetical protein